MPEGSPSDQTQVSAPPGPGPSPESQPRRLIRSRKVAIPVILAIVVIEVGVGLILAHPHARHPQAAPSPAGSARAHRAASPQASRPSPTPSPKHSQLATPPALVPRGLISFENGTDGWKPMFGSIRSAQTTQVAFNGAHSLLITARGTYSAVGVESGLADLRPGDKVTFHIYSDGQQGGSVLPFAERWNHPEDLADNVPLPSHPGWITVTWVVPTVSQVDAIGIQVVHHGTGPLTLAIDALTWPGS
jgi:hypothetical protein